MPGPPDGRFTAAQAARLSGCGPTRLDAWRRIGLVAPVPPPGASTPDSSATYSFRDLVALRMVTALLGEGVPMARIRRAVTALLQAGDDIASLTLVSSGETVLACRDDGQILDALRNGQLALFVSVDQFSRDVDHDVRRFAAERAMFVDVISAPG